MDPMGRELKDLCCRIAVAKKKFQFARRDRSRPAEVLAPVLVPPCIRHRPFTMAGDWQSKLFKFVSIQRKAIHPTNSLKK
jgi:hypothetical protein